MSRKLGLALIAGGIIGASLSLYAFNDACEISKRIKCNFQYQTNDPQKVGFESYQEMRRNEIYGGLSAAGVLASAIAFGSGAYLLSGKKFDCSN